MAIIRSAASVAALLCILSNITTAISALETSNDNFKNEKVAGSAAAALAAGQPQTIEKTAKSIIDYLLAENDDLMMPGPVTNIYRDSDPAHNSQASSSVGPSGQLQTEVPTRLATLNQLSDTTTTTDASPLSDVDQLFNSSETSSILPGGHCKPMESCPLSVLDKTKSNKERSLNGLIHENSNSIREQERPMLLKLDPYHAKDPQLRQANQIKLSQLNGDNLDSAAYKLLNSDVGDLSTRQQQPNYVDYSNYNNQQQQPQQQQNPSKSEMLISFEQTPNLGGGGNPVASLATSQVLKLCSCSCQTMTPAMPPFLPSPLPPTPVVTYPPAPTSGEPETGPPMTSFSTELVSESTTDFEVITTEPPTTSSSTEQPTSTQEPATEPPPPPSPTTASTTTTTSTAQTADIPAQPSSEPPTPTPPPPTTTGSSTTSTAAPITTQQTSPPANNLFANACNLVEWVKPNKTVYESAKIVWDVDRANQNYFLCNNMVDGNELIPGKTHGFSCKLSSEGRALEMHNFQVLTKPENVYLAWVQKNSQTIGKSNLAVIGGYSKNQDPYVVSRCLVRDENNDVITLIGYVNNQGIGLFPFDDIQIECAQYDVLVCVN